MKSPSPRSCFAHRIDWTMECCDEGSEITRTPDRVDWVWAIRDRAQDGTNTRRLFAYNVRRAKLGGYYVREADHNSSGQQ